MPSTHHDRRSRRTQADRRAQTRLAILDATVECLVERGYPHTTTARIARRAGVSVGALQHHFESKADLLTAAIDHVVARREAEFAKAMADRPAEVADFDAAIDILWTLISGPTFTAWLELWVAARTEPDLATPLLASKERFDRAADALFAEWFGHLTGLETPAERAVVLTFTFGALDGLALRVLVGADPVAEDHVLGALKSLSRLLFPPPDDPGSPT